ncbi:SGNH/GDSL hydrolase family protein [Nocardia puris]|uniref:SGNH/GDSL hydrolase family protein n=1 Tax=Nocardia puris TaxID=208602 RepID=UPI001895ACB6|nr:SGNH/GDSL hydrolase family protein [Nocardia puris]MBF6460140.1 SGNH/GDSL hydrolase family protein [Nocardia puris]
MDEPVQLRPLFAQYEPADPPVVSEAWAAARAAEAARDEAVATAATISDIADDVAQVAADRAAAEASATAAAGSATAAGAARTDAESAADAAAGAQSAAATSASDAAADATAADAARAEAVTARDEAVAAAESVEGVPADVAQVASDRAATEAAATAAANSATGAATARTAAESAQSAASTSAGTASSASGAAVSARTAAESARDAAVTARDAATTARADAEAAAATAASAASDAAQSALDAAESAAEAAAGGVQTSRLIATGSGLTGGGDLGADRTIAIATDGVTAAHVADGALPQSKVGTTGHLTTAIEARQLASEKGQPAGYASLDGTGKVPAGQLPASAPAAHTHTLAEISDATAFGRSLASTADAAAARDLLDIEAGGTPVLRTLSFGNGGQGYYSSTVSSTAGSFRVQVKLNTTTTRWRLRIRNWDSIANANKSALTGKTVVVGVHSTPNGADTGNFAGGAGTTVLGTDFTIPGDGTYYVSPWFDDPAAQFQEGVDHLLAIAFTGPSGTVQNGSGRAWVWANATSAVDPAVTAGATVASVPTTWTVEYETLTTKPAWLFIGDSIMEGLSAPRAGAIGPANSNLAYPHHWASMAGALSQNMALSNTLAQSWANPSYHQWSRMTTIGPWDGAVVGLGSNDVAASRTAAQVQADITSIVNNTRAIIGAGKPIYVVNIMPRALSAPEAQRLAVNDWLATLQLDAVTVIDFDKPLRGSSTSALDATMASSDGIHPSWAGKMLLASLLRRYLPTG